MIYSRPIRSDNLGLAIDVWSEGSLVELTVNLGDLMLTSRQIVVELNWLMGHPADVVENWSETKITTFGDRKCKKYFVCE